MHLLGRINHARQNNPLMVSQFRLILQLSKKGFSSRCDLKGSKLPFLLRGRLRPGQRNGLRYQRNQYLSRNH